MYNCSKRFEKTLINPTIVLSQIKSVARKYLYSDSFKASFKRSLPGLCYHSISSNPDFQKNLHNVTANTFSIQIEQLLKLGVTFLPAEEFLLEKSRRKKHKITTLTFDDGYKNLLSEAFPILESFNIPSTVFLCTRLLEGEIFWRDKIRILIEQNQVESFSRWLKDQDEALHRAISFTDFYTSTKWPSVNSRLVEKRVDEFFKKNGISVFDSNLYLTPRDLVSFQDSLVRFGNHTHNHYKMSTLTKVQQHEEITQCQHIIESLGIPLSNSFAIPFGENGSFNEDTLHLIQDCGFTGFFTTNQHQFGQRIPSLPFDSRNYLFSNRILPPDTSFALTL